MITESIILQRLQNGENAENIIEDFKLSLNEICNTYEAKKREEERLSKKLEEEKAKKQREEEERRLKKKAKVETFKPIWENLCAWYAEFYPNVSKAGADMPAERIVELIDLAVSFEESMHKTNNIFSINGKDLNLFDLLF